MTGGLGRIRVRLRSLLQEQASASEAVYARLRTTETLLNHFVLRRPHDAEFGVFAGRPGRGGIFLDVGANSGKSALSFRLFDRRTPILSIEPNRLHERDLRLVRRVIRRFDYRVLGAGEHRQTLALHVPTVRGQRLTGLASVLPPDEIDLAWWLEQNGLAGTGTAVSFHRLEIDVVPLDDLGLRPDFVKVDVEGFELSVLRGLYRTITRHQPLVFIERSADFEAVRSWFEAIGYLGWSFDVRSRSLVPLADLQAVNAVFLPGSQAKGDRTLRQ